MRIRVKSSHCPVEEEDFLAVFRRQRSEDLFFESNLVVFRGEPEDFGVRSSHCPVKEHDGRREFV